MPMNGTDRANIIISVNSLQASIKTVYSKSPHPRVRSNVDNFLLTGNVLMADCQYITYMPQDDKGHDASLWMIMQTEVVMWAL